MEAAELLGHGDGRALVVTEHHEPAVHDVVGDAELGDFEAECVDLVRIVGELGDVNLVTVGRVMVLEREADLHCRCCCIVDMGAGGG